MKTIWRFSPAWSLLAFLILIVLVCEISLAQINCAIPPSVEIVPFLQEQTLSAGLGVQKLTVVLKGFLVLEAQVVIGGVVLLEDGVLWEVLDANTKSFTPVTAAGSLTAHLRPSTEWLEDPPTRPSLSIPSNVLIERQLYTFRVTARNPPNCAFGNATSREISFVVNDRPVNTLSPVVLPLQGISLLTIFTLNTTLGWSDSDLPLEFAFEFVSFEDGEVQQTLLSDFSSSPVLRPRLASQSLKKNFVIAVARDTFGALGFSKPSLEITLDPLYVPNGQIPASQLPPAEAVVGGRISSTAKASLLTVLAHSARSTKNLADIPKLDLPVLEEWRTGIARFIINQISVFQSNEGGQVSPSGVYIFTEALQLALLLEPNIGRDLLEQASRVLDALLSDALNARNLLEDTRFGRSGATAFHPKDFSRLALNAIAQMAKGIDRDNPPPLATLSPSFVEVRRRRQLAVAFPEPSPTSQTPTESPTARPTVSFELSLRKTMNLLLHVSMRGFAPGSREQNLRGRDIQISVATESRLLVGQRGASRLQAGPAAVSFPPRFQLLKNENLRNISLVNRDGGEGIVLPEEIAAQITTVNVAVVRYKFNVREMVDIAQDPPEYNASLQGVYNVDGILVDGFTVQEVTSVLFIASNDPSLLLDPFNLEERVLVTVPLPPGHQPPLAGQTIACGAWNETFNGWSTEGCFVAEVQNTFVVCSCNHASDFAAWTAFLKNVGGGDVGIVVTVSVVVVGSLFPGLLLLYFTFLCWARRRDERDAHGVHVGALLLLTKNALRLKKAQRKFFSALRENAKSKTKIGLAPPAVVEETLAKRKEETDRAFYAKLRKRKSCRDRLLPEFLNRWINALLYDHTVFGVYFRFDPYYTRTQRATVITSVVCGNFFVCALFFDLKTAQDISTSFTIIVVLVSAMVVAIPVKIIIRFLFRETQARTGSTMDRVTHIFRISQMNYDVVPAFQSPAERADLEMLLAFREYYVAKTELKQAESVFEEAADMAREAMGRKHSCCTRRKRISTDSTKRKSLAMRAGLLSDQQHQSDDSSSQPIFDLTGLKKVLLASKENLRNAERNLKLTCSTASKEWSKVPRRPSVRNQTLRQQRSSLMRIASLLFDETDGVRPKPRNKYCAHSFIYLAWFLVLSYLAACLAFSARWLLAYTSIKGDAQQEEDAQVIIVTWLIASLVGCAIGLFITEPALQLVRFSLMPMCLKRCGRGIATHEDIVKRHEELLQRQKTQEKLLISPMSSAEIASSATKQTSNAFTAEGLIASSTNKTIQQERRKTSNNTSGGSFTAVGLIASSTNKTIQEKRKTLQSTRTTSLDEHLEKKAWFQDLFWKRQRDKKKGESHVETASAGLFDFASEVVDAIA